MGTYLSVRDSDSFILGTSSGGGDDVGATTINIKEVTVNGDPLPNNLARMAGGTLTGDGPYTYTAPVVVKKSHKTVPVFI